MRLIKNICVKKKKKRKLLKIQLRHFLYCFQIILFVDHELSQRMLKTFMKKANNYIEMTSCGIEKIGKRDFTETHL